jgi:prepilin-type N-terminal cleavage/methylation domain-containing protein
MRALLARARARVQAAHGDEHGDDRGFTMMEMVVGMTVMAIFMAIFTGSILSIYNTADKAQAINTTSSQLNLAFDNLDREIRYASYIGTQTTEAGTGYWIVSFQTTNTGSPVCTQLRIATPLGQLQQRSWSVIGSAPSTTAANVTAWVPLASNITNGGAAANSSTQPFTMVQANNTVTAEQLNIVLVATSGTGSMGATSTSSVSYVAINTSLTTGNSPTPLCGEVTTP